MSERIRLYNYTVGALLDDAGRRRRKRDPTTRQGFEDDHVIELRLVVAALNELAYGTYNHRNWQRILVDCFNQKCQNSMFLSPQEHTDKTYAVDKWLAWKPLTEKEMKWIKEIRKEWANVKNNLPEFAEFKAALNYILDISDPVSEMPYTVSSGTLNPSIPHRDISAVVTAPQYPQQLPERPQSSHGAPKKWKWLFCCSGKGSATVIPDRDSSNRKSERKAASQSRSGSHKSQSVTIDNAWTQDH